MNGPILIMTIIIALRILLGEASDYDERQTMAQGKAAKYALWAFLGYCIIWIPHSASGLVQLNAHIVLFIGLCLVLLVYMTMAITLNAYAPLRFPGFPWLLLTSGAAFLIYGFIEGRTNTHDTFAPISRIAIGIILVWESTLMLFMQLINKHRHAKEIS